MVEIVVTPRDRVRWAELGDVRQHLSSDFVVRQGEENYYPQAPTCQAATFDSSGTAASFREFPYHREQAHGSGEFGYSSAVAANRRCRVDRVGLMQRRQRANRPRRR